MADNNIPFETGSLDTVRPPMSTEKEIDLKEPPVHVEDGQHSHEPDTDEVSHHKKKRVNKAQDEAAELLAKIGGAREITAEENKRVLKKIDWHLMPILIVIYWAQFFDKQTLSFASVFGIQKDANLHGKEYSWLGSITYLAWYLALPISSYLLVRMRLSILVPGLVTVWGAILALMAAAHNFPGLMVARFFLGAVESIIAPSFVLIGQIWYRRSEQPMRVAVWYSQNAFVNIFGSLIAYGLGHIHSKTLHSYQIIFMITGIVTFVSGIAFFFIFPDNPVKNNFLTEDEKIIAVERLRANNQGVETKDFKWEHIWDMLADIKTYGWFSLIFLVSIPSGGISTFGPLILKSFGFDSYQSMLLNCPFGVAQLIAIFGAFYLSDRIKSKSITLLIVMVPCLIGAGMLYGIGRGPSDKAALLVAYYILAAYTAVTPIILAWQAVNTAGHSKKTLTTAFTAMGQSAGNVVGPLLFDSTQAPYYHSGLTAILIIFCVFAGLTCFVTANLWRLNKRNERRRVAAGKPAKVHDYSMMNEVQAERARQQEREDPERHGQSYVALGSNAFLDLTDQQNDEFIYVY